MIMETPAIIMMTVTFTCVITGVVYFFTKMLRKEREKKLVANLKNRS